MKQKLVGILSLMTAMLFAFATATFAVGDFVIQNSTFDQIFTVNGTTSDMFSVAELYENSTALKDVYWQIISTATPADGEGNLSTADQIYDWVIGLGYTAGWDTLDDMVLTDGYIYVGNSSNEPMGVAVSGDITITNAGVVTVIDSSHVHAGENISSGTVAEARIAATMATDAEVAAVNTTMRSYVDAMNMTGNVTGNIVDTKYCTYNATNALINCESAGGTGLSNIVEDTSPQLGGNLDVNDFGIDGGGSTNMTIDASGNFIIILA